MKNLFAFSASLFFIFTLNFFFIFPAYSQDEYENQETSEEIWEREQFILMRRAGGPGKVIQPGAYQIALRQKSLIREDRFIPNSPTASTNWVSINPMGLWYSRTNDNWISGRTNSIAFHPTNPNIMYIGAAQGGVWKTTNGGVNWIPLTDNLSSLACGDVAIDPQNPDVLYLGTGELNYSGDSQYGDGIFKTTDAGVSWFQVATVSIGTRFSQIAVDPTNSNVVYAAGNYGVYKSTNAGVNWFSTGSGSNANCLLINPSNTQVIYTTVGGYYLGAIYKSTNGAGTWVPLTNGLSGSMGRIQLAMASSNQNILYASVASPSTYGLLGLYKTTDAGDTWTLQTSSPNYLGGQGWYDNAVVIHPTNPDFVIVGGIDIYSSTNGGVTLSQMTQWASTSSSNFSHADIHTLRYNGTVLFCGSDGGVYKSPDNAVSWSDLNHDLSTLQYQSADYDPSNIMYVYGGTQDNNKMTTTNGGLFWNQRTTGDGGYTIVDPVNVNYSYCQYVQGSCQRSANYGVSFTEIRPSGSSGGLFYNPFEMAPGDHNTIVFGRADVWKTTTAQTATTTSGWTQIATTGIVGGNVSAIGISWTNINKIYIGTSNGRILVTSDNGTAWSVTGGYPYVSDFAVDNNDDAECYATLGGTGIQHVLKTTNSGLNWTDISGGLPNIAANSIILRTAPPRMLFAGTDFGVYYSTNEGVSWVGFNSGLPLVEVYDMKYKVANNLLLIATHGRGCWTYDISTVTGINPIRGIVHEFKLNQNYPNPFNPSTRITFDILKDSFVKLIIYDELGREIKSIINQVLKSGRYETQWNASNNPSGVYFYKLTAGDYSDTKKMILVR